MLHPLAQDGLLRITGGFDRDALFEFFRVFHDRIRELNDVAAREHRRTASQDDIDRLDAPLVVGATVLRRPSAAAMQWLADYASRWWTGRRRAWTFALAYACAHRERAAFDGMFSRLRASVICWRFALSIHASEEAIRRAALSLLPPPDDSLLWFSGQDAEDGYDDPRRDLGAIALALAKHYGGTPEHWLWEVADDDFWKAVCGMADESEAGADPKRDDPDSWWRRHRRALLKCETALEKDAVKWAEARKPKTEGAAHG